MTEFLARITKHRSQAQLKPPKLKAIQGGDRIDSYLTRFEQHKTTYNIRKDEWPAQLRALLEDDALTAFLALMAMEAKDSDTTKATLLERMGITAETQQKRWWEATIKPNETATQWTVRLWDLTSYCVTDCTTPMEAGKKFATEHGLQMLPSNVALWVQTQKTQTLKQVGRLTDQYLQDRNLDHSILRKQKRWMPYQHPSYADGKRPTTPSEVDKPNSGIDTGKANAFLTLEASTIWKKYLDKAKGPFCFGCKDWGHIAAHCPKKTVFACEPVCNHSDDYLIKGKLNGVDVQFKLDTSCITFTHFSLCYSKVVLTGENLSLVWVKGPPVEFDLAEISINLDGTQADITIAVIDDMGTDALLGQDISFIKQLLKSLVDELLSTDKEGNS